VDAFKIGNSVGRPYPTGLIFEKGSELKRKMLNVTWKRLPKCRQAKSTSRVLTKIASPPVVCDVPQERRAQQKSRIKKDPGPRVGIFFAVDDHILLEATPLAEGEPYGKIIGHARGHEQFWEDLQSTGQVPRDEDYIRVPRGRVICDRPGQFTILLDRCILRKPKLAREIRRQLNLPSRGLKVSLDSHYRCAACMEKGGPF